MFLSASGRMTCAVQANASVAVPLLFMPGGCHGGQLYALWDIGCLNSLCCTRIQSTNEDP